MTPFSDGIFTLVPTVGTLCLIGGIARGSVQREPRLLFFLVPFTLSEALVAVAGLLRGKVEASVANSILLNFLAVQLLVSVLLVCHIKSARLPGALLAIFSITYAFCGIFVAGMTFFNEQLLGISYFGDACNNH